MMSVSCRLRNSGKTPNQFIGLLMSKHGGWRSENRNDFENVFEGYYNNLLHTGDAKEGDNVIDNIMSKKCTYFRPANT